MSLALSENGQVYLHNVFLCVYTYIYTHTYIYIHIHTCIGLTLTLTRGGDVTLTGGAAIYSCTVANVRHNE